MSGRPLRFIGVVAGGWIALRALLWWSDTGEVIREVAPVTALPSVAIATARAPVTPSINAAVQPVAPLAARSIPLALWLVPKPARVASDGPGEPRLALIATVEPVAEAAEPDAAPAPQSAPPVLALLPRPPPQPRRWSASGWLIARGGTGIGASPDAPQLGGAQGGVRVDYALRHGFAATGRIAAPAAGAGREVSLGMAWRPATLPVRLVVERRFALDRGRGGPAIGISGGIYSRLPAGFRLEGYAQGGTIFRDGAEHYVDGLVRAARPVAGRGGYEVDLGIGGWGGAQRGVARFDAGPSIGVRLPVADRAVRLSLDWRQRIAGDARPGSGPALTIGSDF